MIYFNLEMKTPILIILQLLFLNAIPAQLIEHPVVEEKSHPTLTIVKIEKVESETVFHMAIVNMLAEGGWFCIDKAVKVKSIETGEEIKIQRSEGLPLCPDAHRFSKIGEELSFRLYFPALPDEIIEIDLIEDCDDNCFYFKGIVLDNTLNSEIRTFEKGLSQYSNNDHDAALRSFTLVRDNSIFKNRKHYGYSIFIIPVIYHNSGDPDAARLAYKILLDTEFGNKVYFIAQLQKIDFFKNLSF
jgi:hypothetical protein